MNARYRNNDFRYPQRAERQPPSRYGYHPDPTPLPAEDTQPSKRSQKRKRQRQAQEQAQQQLKNEIGDLDQEVEELDEENTELMIERDDLREEVRRLRNELNAKDKILSKLQKPPEVAYKGGVPGVHPDQSRSQHEARNMVRQAMNTIQTHASQMFQIQQPSESSLRFEIKEQAQRIEELVGKNKELRKRLSEQEGLITKAQDDIFACKDGGVWETDPDPTIGGELSSLADKIRAFAKTHAAPLGDGSLLHSFYDMEAELEATAVPMSTLHQLFNNSQYERCAVYLVLSAWISRTICRIIFDEPFYFIGEFMAPRSDSKQRKQGRVLREFLNMMETSYGPKSKQFNTLRSDVSRLLHPIATENETNEIKGLRYCINDAKEMVNTRLEDKLLTAKSQFLAIPSAQEAAQQIQDMLNTASDIATKLHCQRSRVVSLGLDKLPEVFDSRSKLLEAHTWHNKELDEDEKCLDGRPVLLVTQPAIVAYGKSDGSNYEAVRVLKKAIVWMGMSPNEDVGMNELPVDELQQDRALSKIKDEVAID